jgi:hypothetical protein
MRMRVSAGWPSKTDAEHVPGLALVEVGGRVDAGDARDVRVLERHLRLQPEAAAERHRQQVVDDVEPLGLAGVVDAGHAEQQLVALVGSSRRCCATSATRSGARAASARRGRRRRG